MGGAILEFTVLLMAHAAAGLYSASLKYSKKVAYAIWGAWVILQTGVMYFSEFAVPDPGLQLLLGFGVTMVGQYVIFFMTTTGKFSQRLFTMLTYSTFFSIFMTLFNAVRGEFSQIHPLLAVSILFVTLFGVVAYFLLHVCPLCRAAGRNITRGWKRLIAVNVIFMITVFFAAFYPDRLDSIRDEFFVPFLFLSIAILAVYPVMFSCIIHMSEAAIKHEVETQNKLLLAQIEVENARLAADRQSRHDRRHHNLVLLEFANQNDINGVREYLHNLVESESQIWPAARYCEHLTVNTVLSVYERRAKESAITTDITAQIGGELAIPPQDLVIVIANLFENAIHATAPIKKRDKYIRVVVRESARRLLVQVENPCQEKLSFDESNFGVGLHSVVSVVEKYNGMYDFTAKDGVFSAKVSLNLD